MEQKIMEILNKMHPTVDFASAEGLVDEGILDSLDIVTLVTELNATFEVSIPAVEILPSNFNSVEALADMIRRLDDI